MELYAEFDSLYDPPRLRSFLMQSPFYPLQEALDTCQKYHRYAEMVYVLGKMGNPTEALHMIVTRLRDIKQVRGRGDMRRHSNDCRFWQDVRARMPGFGGGGGGNGGGGGDVSNAGGLGTTQPRTCCCCGCTSRRSTLSKRKKMTTCGTCCSRS